MTLVGIVSPFLLSRQLYLVISCYSVSNNYFLYIEHSRTRNKEINTCLRQNSNYLLIIRVNTFHYFVRSDDFRPGLHNNDMKLKITLAIIVLWKKIVGIVGN